MVRNQATQWPARTAVKERNRDALLTAARELAAERGFAGTSVDAVAERAGVTKGAVYSIFGSKVELFAAVLTPEWGVLGLSDVVGPGVDLRTALAAYGRGWAEKAGTDAARSAFVLALEMHLEAMRQPHVLPRVLSIGRAAIERLAEEIAERAEASGVTLRRSATDVASSLVGALQGLTQQVLVGLVPLDPEQFAAVAVALLGDAR
jgi:AcrR family transcriptional regulator